MFFIPGIVISIATFPGVIVHELAHQLFCRWCRVAVFKVVYFQFANPVGYVLHEAPRSAFQSILISTGPFLVNSIIGFLIAFPASIHKMDGSGDPLDLLLLYLGISIAMHAFPSRGDAETMWNSVMKREGANPIAKVLAVPLVGLIYIGAFGSMVWLDAIYGIAIAIGLPKLIIDLLA